MHKEICRKLVEEVIIMHKRSELCSIIIGIIIVSHANFLINFIIIIIYKAFCLPVK